MRRVACLLLVAAFVSTCAFAQTNKAFMNRIATARFILVTTENGDPINPNVMPEDRQAVFAIQKQIQDWKRFTLVYKPEDADIILAVRTGGMVRGNSGVSIRRGATFPGDPGTYPGQTVPPQRAGTRVGSVTNADAGPEDDMITVYDATSFSDGTILWRSIQRNGLSAKTPLFDRFRKDVEKTDAERLKNSKSAPKP